MDVFTDLHIYAVLTDLYETIIEKPSTVDMTSLSQIKCLPATGYFIFVKRWKSEGLNQLKLVQSHNHGQQPASTQSDIPLVLKEILVTIGQVLGVNEKVLDLNLEGPGGDSIGF